MKGYVKNIGKAPIYIFKGVVNVNEVITFDVLLKKLGDVADISNERAFSNWLAKNKFIDKRKWQIVTEKSIKKVTEKAVEEVKPTAVEGELEKIEPVSKVTAVNKEIIKQSVTGVKKEVTIDYIVNIKTATAKKDVGRIADLKLLKGALKKAEGMTKKATLCNVLIDRIAELSIR